MHGRARNPYASFRPLPLCPRCNAGSRSHKSWPIPEWIHPEFYFLDMIQITNEESFDVLDKNGETTGVVKPRSKVHRDGDWHRTVHVWITDAKGGVLLQKRSAGKETYPGLWDISSAGHVQAGSTHEAAAIREVREEIGIRVREEELHYLGTVRQCYCPGDRPIRDCEFARVYVVKKTLSLRELRLDPNEVDQVQRVRLESLEKRVAANDPVLVPHPDEYPLLFAFLS